MANVYRPGEIWVNSLGREIEVVGTDLCEVEVSGVRAEVDLLAYRFAAHGSSGHVFIRAESSTQAWTKKEI